MRIITYAAIKAVLLFVLDRLIAVEGQQSDVPAASGVIWTVTGGGWRSMAASSAYAQVFAKLGLFGVDGTVNIDSATFTSGSAWFANQFFFSENYNKAIVDGTPASLGEFTRLWLQAYASTQANISNSCGPLQELCDSASQLPPGSPLEPILQLLPLLNHFNFSWPTFIYDMFDATSATYDDSSFVNTRATSVNKLSSLNGIDVCFHSSLAPNMRSKEDGTMTYLAKDVNDTSTAYTVPLPINWCVGGQTEQNEEWFTPNFPISGAEGLVYPAPATFSGSSAYENFPMFPPDASDSLYAEPAGNFSGNVQMTEPFGGKPTTVQIGAASASTMGYISEELSTVFAQFMSLMSFSIKSSTTMPEKEKAVLLGTLNSVQNLFWKTGIMANLATCTAWESPDPRDMPGCQKDNFWLYDGGYTDGPSAGLAIARYQESHGTSGEIKLILSNNNFIGDNMNNVLGYFATSWNEGVAAPGDFIWSPSVGSGPQKNPWQSTQIFEEYLDTDMFNAASEPISGTNLTLALISATTVSNPAFGVQGGQKVSLAILNINEDIPTFLVTYPVIEANIPKMVDMVESIASSQDLAEKIRAFTNVESTSSARSTNVESKSEPESSASSAVVSLAFFLSSLSVLLLSQAL